MYWILNPSDQRVVDFFNAWKHWLHDSMGIVDHIMVRKGLRVIDIFVADPDGIVRFAWMSYPCLSPSFSSQLQYIHSRMKKKYHIWYFQWEPMSVPYHQKRFYHLMDRIPLDILHHVTVFDYSRWNCQIHRSRKPPLRISSIYYVPYPIMENHLVNWASTNFKYDLVFCGTLTPYRQKVLRAIRTALPSLCLHVVHHTYGTKRDEDISASRFLLNLHGGPSFTVFEHLRCDPWLFQGMPIISEWCSFVDKDTIWRAYVYMPPQACTIETFVDFITDLLQNMSVTMENYRTRFYYNQTMLKKQRRQELDELCQLLL